MKKRVNEREAEYLHEVAELKEKMLDLQFQVN